MRLSSNITAILLNLTMPNDKSPAPETAIGTWIWTSHWVASSCGFIQHSANHKWCEQKLLQYSLKGWKMGKIHKLSMRILPSMLHPWT